MDPPRASGILTPALHPPLTLNKYQIRLYEGLLGLLWTLFWVWGYMAGGSIGLYNRKTPIVPLFLQPVLPQTANRNVGNVCTCAALS